MSKQSRHTLLGILACAALVVLFSSATRPRSPARAETPATGGTRYNNPVDGQRAYGYLKQICEIGPRISGTAGMQQQRELLTEHFEALGGEVELQRFRARHPRTRQWVSMANLIVTWHPETKQRILLCTHYDTRPLPDRDPNFRLRRSGTFLGANDGASGVALLMELGHLMPDLDSNYGVDFVLLDAEELVYDERLGTYFLGSEWFARRYVADPPEHRYRWGVLLDMVGDANLQIYQERYSMFWKDTRPLVTEIWDTAQRLGVEEFVPQRKHEVKDDHLKLRNIAKIPTCDIIDFDYPTDGNRYWHTTADVPANCSGESLAKVGWVVHHWLQSTK